MNLLKRTLYQQASYVCLKIKKINKKALHEGLNMKKYFKDGLAFFLRQMFLVFRSEFINTARSIYQLLLTRIKWVRGV